MFTQFYVDMNTQTLSDDYLEKSQKVEIYLLYCKQNKVYSMLNKKDTCSSLNFVLIYLSKILKYIKKRINFEGDKLREGKCTF